MRDTLRASFLAAAAATLLAVPLASRADEAADAKAIIEKAVKAHGGIDRLSRHKAMTQKSKGTFYGFGAGLDYSGTTSTLLPDKTRSETQFDLMGKKMDIVQIYSGDKGWALQNGTAVNLPAEALEEAREEMWDAWVSQLYPLLSDAEFSLSPLEAIKVGGHAAVGVKVAHKGHRELRLYFDKETGLLTRSESTRKDLQKGGSEVKQETDFSDYRELQGLKVAHKVSIRRDGQKYIEGEVTEMKLSEKLDDQLFAKP